MAFWLLPASFIAWMAGCEPQTVYADYAYTPEQVANAIYLAEGGERTRHPYGVLSVRVSGEVEARRVCLNSIRNSRHRWERAGRPGDWLVYFGQRWCPVGAENDPAGFNQNWVRNVRYFLDKEVVR